MKSIAYSPRAGGAEDRADGAALAALDGAEQELRDAGLAEREAAVQGHRPVVLIMLLFGSNRYTYPYPHTHTHTHTKR